MKDYSPEFRRDVLAARDAGGGARDVASRFGVSTAWVRRIKQRRRELGKAAPCRTRKRIPKWMSEAERSRQAAEEKPDMTLLQLKNHLRTQLSVQTLCRALNAMKLTFKKKVLIAAEQLRPDVAKKRDEWRSKQAQCIVDP